MQEGGVRIDLRTNIFNLIRNPDATIKDLEKLYGIAPEKFRYKENDLFPIELAEKEDRRDWVEFMKSKGLKASNAPVEKVVEKKEIIKKEKKLDGKTVYAHLKDFVEKDDIEKIDEYFKNKITSTLTATQLSNFLELIISKDKLNIFELLLKNNYIKFDSVVRRNSIEKIKFLNLLIQYGLDVNKKYGNIGIEPLRYILQGNYFVIKEKDTKELFELMMKNKGDIYRKPDGYTYPYILFSNNLSIDLKEYYLNKFIEKGINLNEETSSKGHDIMSAIFYDYLTHNHSQFKRYKDIIKTVVENNYDINKGFYTTVSQRMSTLLIEVINEYKHNKEVVTELFDYLIEKNVDINQENERGNQPIHVCAFYNFIHGLKVLLEKGVNINTLSKIDGFTPLMMAVRGSANRIDTLDTIRFLLSKNANKSIKSSRDRLTALQNAYYYKKNYGGTNLDEIITLLEKDDDEEEDEKLWKGFTKNDVDKFETFFESPNDYSVCPVCLSYVARQDGCMFMRHDCKEDNKYYHKKLYNKYVYESSSSGLKGIEWCTICGRVSKGHQHYELVNSGASVPDFAKQKPKIIQREGPAVYFDDNNCKGLGGGGLEEKVARLRRLREYALELNDDIDKIKYAEAYNQLIEEAWNAPIVRSKKPKKILEEKKWNITLKNFPSPTNKKNENEKEKENNKNYPNIPFTGKKPVKKDAGECPCVIGGEDDIVTYSFHHESREGGMNHDDMCICAEDLTEAIKSINKAYKNVERPFGYCWFYKCKAKLYPEEIKGIVPNEVYQEYKKKFNKLMAQKGGRFNKTRKIYSGNSSKSSNTKNVLVKVNLDHATCYQPKLKKM